MKSKLNESLLLEVIGGYDACGGKCFQLDFNTSLSSEELAKKRQAILTSYNRRMMGSLCCGILKVYLAIFGAIFLGCFAVGGVYTLGMILK